MGRAEEENALAASLGFEAILDRNRGGPFCKFRNRDISVLECIYRSKVAWVRISYQNNDYTQAFFPSLKDALTNNLEAVL